LSRYFIFISFKGTSYHGWQKQPRSLSVQTLLDEALSNILGEKIESTGAGRTDAGVHALFFCAHFNSVAEDLAQRQNLVFRLNRFLPPDISVSAIKKVRPDVSARFNAVSRTYEYRIARVKDPFSLDLAWFVHGFLDIDLMNKALKILMGHSDFTSFCRLHSDSKTNICHISYARWKKEGNMIVFTIKADRFLRNMVRAIVGTVIEVGKQRKNLLDFEKTILARDRSKAGTSAPAKGLFLKEIEYPDEVFL
jgi:tRNA pseudouridine38-40 synthase